ncbi:hypothetical protein BMF35_a2101 [Aurantiacibacter gangjinensis]|nr:hypothetical protein BMF35_a2101 [Aurantiacibacter gangjinensis]
MFLKEFYKKLLDDTSGATAIEYGLILAMICIAMIVAMQGFANAAIGLWDYVDSNVDTATSNQGA